VSGLAGFTRLPFIMGGEKMRHIKWLLNHIEEIISSFLIFMIFILLAVSIIFRQVGISSSEIHELIKYGFVVSILFGISFGAKEREHIRADVILEHVSEKVKKGMLFVADLIWLFFSLGLFWYSIPFIKKMIDFPQHTPMLEIPFWVLYGMIPVSAVLTCIRIVQNMVADFNVNKI